MKRLLRVVCLSVILVPFFSMAQKKSWREQSNNPDYLHRALKQVTDIIVHDIYSPPVASRTYAYVSVAAYESLRFLRPEFLSLAGQLQQLTPFEQPSPSKEYCFTLAAVNAVLLTGKTMVISDDAMEEFRKKILQEFTALGMPRQVFENSIAFGKTISDKVLAWAAADNYKQSRAYPKYTVDDDNGSWKPTPPAYMKAIEPYWNKIRPFVVDSATQFKPLPALNFSTDSNSAFYKEAREVQEIGSSLTEEQRQQANFWDCNPFKMNINGHVMYATKKISPGGHWINITRLACRQTHADAVSSAEAYVRVALALADAFISCWDEKYRSRVIRPETYINRYISQSWMPMLQTPPFPEYTSGHSVVSAASSVILTQLFGESFAYTDSTELEFEIPVRHFKSFSDAAAEAAISRLYGGIHYMASIKNGMLEGAAIGKFISSKLVTRTNAATAPAAKKQLANSSHTLKKTY